MNAFVQKIKRVFMAVFVGLIMATCAAPQAMPVDWQSAYDQGVEMYRNGDYEKAMKTFSIVIQQAPESIEGRYYYAITLAQLGRFKEASEAYNNVIKLSPESDAAKLAQQGIDSLPGPKDLDAPPQFKKAGKGKSAPPDAQATTTPAGTPAQAAQNPMGGMDPQTMQMMMMMGSMGGGGGGGGFNPMMIPMMQSMMQGKDGKSDPQNTIPPEAYSSMMMNQMMQNFNPFGGDKQDE